MPHLQRRYDIFAAARQLRTQAERDRYVHEACRDDEELKRNLIELLDCSQAATGFLEQPLRVDDGVVDDPAVELLQELPDSRIGNYRLLEMIGEGGFALVFAAEQQGEVQREVAVKVIKPGMDSREVVSRFQAEREAMARLHHPSIVTILDAGITSHGRPYLAMELVRGVTITDYCFANYLSLRERLTLFLNLCRAVQHAHHCGIIHRDLKPDNILVTMVDQQPLIKIIDFGVAKALGESSQSLELTHVKTSQVLGTPLYMSPEQAESPAHADTRSDVYSLGVILYELITGETPLAQEPLAAESVDAWRQAMRESEPRAPSERLLSSEELLISAAAGLSTEPGRLVAAVRGDLDRVVLQALARDLGTRYQTAVHLARDIEHYLNGDPVSAVPSSAAYVFCKFARKYRHLVSAAIGACLLLLLTTGISTVMALRAIRAERQASINLHATLTAQHDRTRALIEAANTEQELRYLINDLFLNAIGQGPASDIPLRDVLKSMSLLLDQNPPAEQIIDARVSESLAKTLVKLHEYGEAEQLLRRSVAIRARVLGPNSTETLDAQQLLGEVLRQQHKLEAAEAVFLEILRRFEDRGGMVGEERQLAAKFELANTLCGQGRVQEANELAEHVLKMRQNRVGKDSLELLQSHHQVAATRLAVGHAKSAIFLLQDCLQRYLLSFGPSHPDVMQCQVVLGGAYQLDQRYEDARHTYEQVLTTQRCKLGADHVDTLATELHLASVDAHLGRFDEAERLFLATLERQRRLLGPRAPMTLKTQSNLAKLYLSQKRFDDAESLLVPTLARMEWRLGEFHEYTVVCRHLLARLFTERGQRDDALPLLQEVLANSIRLEGESSRHTWQIQTELATLYRDRGDPLAAEKLFRESLAGQQRHLGQSDLDTLATSREYATLCQLLGRDEDARRLRQLNGTPSSAASQAVEADTRLPRTRERLASDEVVTEHE